MDKISFAIPLTPRTKKNSRQSSGAGITRPSKAFLKFQEDAGWYIPHKHEKINKRLNIKCLFYMKIDYANTAAVIDLVGLLQAIDDILVHYGVIQDDNCRIVAGHDGSRVLHDKKNPRVEIEIEEITEE